ncbi:MAG: hypothetical protein FWC40_08815, partial [Proteobacteria bacterium]|nr:hypothetical protein [Pseudomonadota bacterium]
MTLPWTDDLVRIVRDAERDAGEMRVRLNTALLLRSVFRVPSAARDILSGFGVTLESYEHGLCAHSLRPEPSDMSQRLYDRASRLAALAREDSVRATHILMAILDERCMGQSLLLALGLDFERVRSCLYGHAEPVQTHAQAHVRSNSQVSMSAVAVQRKSSTLTPTRYIEPRPSVSFGQEYAASFEVGVADTLESLEQVPALPMRQKRMTPEEIQDLMPPVKRCNETAGAD